MSWPWRGARSAAFDVVIVLGALVAALEVAFRHDPATEPTSSPWFAVPAVACIILVLLGRRRFPFLAPAAVWLLAATVSFVDGRLVTFTVSVYAAGMVAALLLGSLPDPVQGRIGLALVLGGAVIVVSNDPAHVASEYVFVPALFAIAWLAGFALRERGARAEAAEESARRAGFEERVRIARELHDVVAHHVSVMGVQAGAARMVIDRDPAQAEEALASIERSSRQAVAELHRLLGFLRQASDTDDLAPRPGLDELEQLAESLRDSELAVEVCVEGERRALPPTVDVSAYRIVQEALTNTLKHSVASRAAVHLRYWPDELELEIVDDGRPTGTPPVASSGLGLIGMRERAALCGGELSAGPAAGGGFTVHVRLRTPVEAP